MFCLICFGMPYSVVFCDVIWKTCSSSKDIVVSICRPVMDFGIE